MTTPYGPFQSGDVSRSIGALESEVRVLSLQVRDVSVKLDRLEEVVAKNGAAWRLFRWVVGVAIATAGACGAFLHSLIVQALGK